MKVIAYNQEGKEAGQTLLPKEIFDVKLSPDLVHQIVVSQRANQRKVIAHTKDRSEVRGGGRKPWRQKGTGRARHGSRRSPIWVGGGVTFGPTKERVFKKKIPKRMRKTSLFMALSVKAKDGFLIVLDNFKLESFKTKALFQVLKKLKAENALIVLPKVDRNVILAARNLPKVKTIEARELNPLDIFTYKYLVMPKEAVKVIKDTFLK